MNNITIVISINGDGNPKRRDFESWLLDQLPKKTKANLLVIPNLIDLRADGPSIRAIANAADDILLLSWIFPRPAFWTLRSNGIDGRAGHSFDAKTERTICCLQLDLDAGHEAILGQVIQLTGALRGRGSQVSHITEVTKRRWYPVIDYDRCSNCLECLNFCLFGVFELDKADQIKVQEPDACRDGCPACSRVCPSSAISFPRCIEKTIAGSDETVDSTRGRGGLDILGPKACECKLPKPRKTSDKSNVDDLIEKLDELDL